MFTKVKKLFTDHPNEVNETYFGHMRFALRCSTRFLLLHLMCLIHAFFPFLFTKTSGKWVKQMSEDISSKYEN